MEFVNPLAAQVDRYGMANSALAKVDIIGMVHIVCFVSMGKYGILLLGLVFVNKIIVGMAISVKDLAIVRGAGFSIEIIKSVFVLMISTGMEIVV